MVLIGLSVPVSVFALTVEGKSFEPTRAVHGTTLELVGAGLREKGLIDVYVLGAYTESGSCNRKRIIEDEEVKYLRFEMLRSVKGSKMASTIGDAFDEAIPEGADSELQRQRETFKGYFKQTVAKDQVMEFTYVPGAGVVIVQDGKELGPPLSGKRFQEVLWSIYFGSRTCCTELRQQLLESCQ